MEENGIKTIDIEDIVRNDPLIDYIDEDIIVTRHIENLPYQNEPVRMNLFTIVICEAGRAQLDINGKTHQLHAGEMLICLPTMIVSNALFSSGYRMALIGFSTRFLHRFVKREPDTGNVIYHIYKNPVFTPEPPDKETDARFHHYGELILGKVKERTHRYQKEILQYLFSALFHEMLSVISREVRVSQEQETTIHSGGLLFKRFMEEVAKDGGVHRSVGYYAERLCYSPKYLSTVVKQASGRTTLDWIHEYAIEQIKRRLKHSDKSVKEIADEFNFPNQSFFGKYVKAHLGMSPARYRNQPE